MWFFFCMICKTKVTGGNNAPELGVWVACRKIYGAKTSE